MTAKALPAKARVRLCLPPNYSFNYNFPPLGTPCLAGYLKSRGYGVIQEDRNFDYLDFMSERLGLPEGAGLRRDLVVRKLLNRIFLDKAESGLYYADLLPGEVDEYTPYDDNTNSSFHFTERLLSSDSLERYLDDDAENTFRRYFLERGLPERVVADSDVLGLSLISPAQVIAALTLGRLVKALKPDFPIVWGGPWPSLFRSELAGWGKLQAFADVVVIDEGETPLHEYLKVLAGEGSLAEVPNLLFRDGSRWRFSRKRTEEDLSLLPAPDFDGMPVERYFYGQENGRRTLTYQTSRECYWNRCTYCVDLPFPKHTYREKPVELVIRDIRELQARYGADELMLSDLAMAPHYMRKLSERLIAEKIDVRWWTFARLDGDLGSEIFELAARAGCYRVSYGFESANQRVCDFIDKGTRLKTMSQVIKACGSSGIKVTLQTMIGLPTETADEALDTISFLLDHRDFINDVCYNIYYLTPGNYIYRDLAKNRMVPDERERLPFRFFIDFNHADETSLGRPRARALIRYYQKRVRELRGAFPEPEPDWKSFLPRFDAGRFVRARLAIGRESSRLYCHPTGDPDLWLLADENEHVFLRLMDGRRTVAQIAEAAKAERERVLEFCRDLHRSRLWPAETTAALSCP